MIDAPNFGAILGVPWLQEHNPKTIWTAHTVILDSSHSLGFYYQEDSDWVSPLTCATIVSKAQEIKLPRLYLRVLGQFLIK